MRQPFLGLVLCASHPVIITLGKRRSGRGPRDPDHLAHPPRKAYWGDDIDYTQRRCITSPKSHSEWSKGWSAHRALSSCLLTIAPPHPPDFLFDIKVLQTAKAGFELTLQVRWLQVTLRNEEVPGVSKHLMTGQKCPSLRRLKGN